MDKPVIDPHSDWFKPFMSDTDPGKFSKTEPKTAPKSRYYHNMDGYDMLHAYKVTPGKRVLHLNMTHDHINALNHSGFRFDNMEEITEAKFNEYKYDVLKRLDVI